MRYDQLLLGKRALITGGGPICQACAALFAAHGATICQTDAPDIWLNADNAYHYAFADEITDAQLGEMLTQNLTNLFATATRVLPNMRASGGSIVFIGSDYARSGGNGVSAYAATMGGQLGFANGLALELLPNNVRVNSLLLGFGARPGDDDFGDDAEFWRGMIPLSRRMTMDEIANAALFLASDMSRGMSAEGMTMNGGSGIIAHKHGYRRVPYRYSERRAPQ